LNRAAHVCQLYEGINEQKAVVLPFVREGLIRGEACLYVTGRQSVDDWYLEFQSYGIDVQRERLGKALLVMPGLEYRQPEHFSSIVKARELLDFIEDKLADFSGVRIIGDVAWERFPPLPVEQVCHWEATANLVFEDQDVRTICQYDLGSDSPSLIHSALRTHPLVILGQRLYRNPYYEAPRILEDEPYSNHSDADAMRIDTMLKEIRLAPELLMQ
jgi:hypothetical protein